MQLPPVTLALTLSISALLATPAAAQDFPCGPQLAFGTTGYEGSFGSSMALDGNLLVVGKPDHKTGTNGTSGGAAFIYERASATADWEIVRTLLPNNGSSSIEFGAAVDVSGDRIVVGAPGDSNPGGVQTGRVYVFDRGPGGWALATTLAPSVATSGARFGRAVSVNGDQVFAGAPFDSSGGAVYLLAETGSGWNEFARLTGTAAGLSRHGWELAANSGFMVTSNQPGTSTRGVFGYRIVANSAIPLGLLADSGSSQLGESLALDGSLAASAFDGSTAPSPDVAGLARIWNLSNIAATPTATSPIGDAANTSVTVALDAGRLAVRVQTPSSSSSATDLVRVFDDPSLGTLAQSGTLCRTSSLSGANAERILFDADALLAADPRGETGLVRRLALDGSSTFAELEAIQPVFDLSKSLGADLDLVSSFDPSLAGRLCWTLGSLSGSSPGLPLLIGTIPLNPDGYTNAILANPATGPVKNSIGILDANGQRTVNIPVPPNVVQTMAGRTATHASIVLDTITFDVLEISNVVEVLITP